MHDLGRDLVHCDDGLPMVDVAQGLSGLDDVQGYVYRWRDAGVWSTINHHLVAAAREAVGREVSPTAGVMTASR